MRFMRLSQKRRTMKNPARFRGDRPAEKDFFALLQKSRKLLTNILLFLNYSLMFGAQFLVPFFVKDNFLLIRSS